MIPVSKSGSNYAFTIFFQWDKGIQKCFKLDGYELLSLNQISNYPLLKANYYAGCCDFRYLATGIIAFTNECPESLFLIPAFAKNEKDRLSAPYVHSDIYFKLFSNVDVSQLSEPDKYQINITIWVLEPSYKLFINDFF